MRISVGSGGLGLQKNDLGKGPHSVDTNETGQNPRARVGRETLVVGERWVNQRARAAAGTRSND